MNINKELLIKLFEKLIDRIGCDECPFEEQCPGMNDTKDCADFYLKQIKEKE